MYTEWRYPLHSWIQLTLFKFCWRFLKKKSQKYYSRCLPHRSEGQSWPRLTCQVWYSLVIMQPNMQIHSLIYFSCTFNNNVQIAKFAMNGYALVTFCLWHMTLKPQINTNLLCHKIILESWISYCKMASNRHYWSHKTKHYTYDSINSNMAWHVHGLMMNYCPKYISNVSWKLTDGKR